MRKTLLESIDRWKQAAALGVDDIGGWRDAAPSRKDWPTAPERFYLDTSYLVGRIVSDFPKLDPEPLQGIYSAVSVWHNEHHAGNLPPQAVLFSTLERAMMTLGVVSDSLLVKPEGGETPSTPEATKQETPTRFHPDIWRAYWFAQSGYTQERIAEWLHTKQGTVSKWIAKVEKWKAAGNKMPEIPKRDALTGKPLALDPSKIDLGPRQDHRPEHTRQKRAEMLGHGWQEPE